MKRSQTEEDKTAPLWKWLFNPKLRSQLHENRTISIITTSESNKNNNNNNPIISREASLWKWRLKLQGILAQGQPIVPEKNNNYYSQHHQKYRLGFFTTTSSSQGAQQQTTNTSSLLESTATSFLAVKKKSDQRFAAKTLAANLISEIQTRTIQLMSMNLTPIGRSSVGGSRFDTLPELRLASLEALQRRCVPKPSSSSSASSSSHHDDVENEKRLQEEYLEWKNCLASIMISSNTTNEKKKVLDDFNQQQHLSSPTAVIVVPQKVFVLVGSRIGQLCTLSEDEEEIRNSSTKTTDLHTNNNEALFVKILERDWATLCAQGGNHRINHRSSPVALLREDGATKDLPMTTVTGLSFTEWFQSFLLPVAVVLAPAHSSMNEETMISHAADFCCALRSILFPKVTSYREKKFDDMAANQQLSHQQNKTSRHLHSSSAAARVVVGDQSSKNPIISYHAAYEQRILSSGFYEPSSPSAAATNNGATSTTAGKTQQRAQTAQGNAAATRSSPPTLLPSSFSPPQQQRSRPQTSGASPAVSSSSPFSAGAKNNSNNNNQRKMPKVIQELVARQEQQQQQQQQQYHLSYSRLTTSDEIMRGIIHVSPTHPPDFHQPFPRNIVREGPVTKESQNVHQHRSNSPGAGAVVENASPLNLVIMDFKKTIQASRNKEREPSVPKSARQQVIESQKQFYKELIERQQRKKSASASEAALGEMPQVPPQSYAFSIHVNASPTRFLGTGGEGRKTTSPERASKPRAFIHSKDDMTCGRNKNVKERLLIPPSQLTTVESAAAAAVDPLLARKLSLSSTGRSLKNRVPKELTSLKLDSSLKQAFDAIATLTQNMKKEGAFSKLTTHTHKSPLKNQTKQIKKMEQNIADASHGRFISIVMTDKDFDPKTGKLSTEGAERIEGQVRKSCKDMSMNLQIIRGYKSAAQRLYSTGGDGRDSFEVFAYSCVVHFRDSRPKEEEVKWDDEEEDPYKLEADDGEAVEKKNKADA